MPQHAIPAAWFERLAELMRAARAARPDLSPLSSGRCESVLKTALEAMRQETGLSFGALRSRWRIMRESHPSLVPEFMRVGPFDPAPAFAASADAELERRPALEPAPPTLDERVEISRHQRTAREASRALRDATARIAEMQDRLSDYEASMQSAVRPADWTLAPRMAEPAEHIPELLTSDFQIGEVIRAEETDHAHGYDVATFRRRYRLLISTTIDLCFNHAAESWRYPGIIYARGGDTISGAIHDELAETDELTPIEAVEIAFEEEAAGIAHLAKAFDRVEVKEAGGGNHDRDTKKPHTKRASGHSFDRLVSYMLRREFLSDERVTFQGTLSPDVYFPIYRQNILLTHGDKIGSRGGMGMVGPAATISRGFQKVILEQQALGRSVDMVQCGHFHTPLWLETGISNGCLPGFSEFAKSNRMRPHPPSQFLLFFSPLRGLVDVRKVVLESPEPLTAA